VVGAGASPCASDMQCLRWGWMPLSVFLPFSNEVSTGDIFSSDQSSTNAAYSNLIPKGTLNEGFIFIEWGATYVTMQKIYETMHCGGCFVCRKQQNEPPS
jgi:hypothetical protein